MKLSPEEVLKIATLARLELTPDEVGRYGDQLSSILSYVEKLNTLDVAGVEPTAHAVSVDTPFREDAKILDSTREKSLKNAPSREETLFKVAKVLA